MREYVFHDSFVYPRLVQFQLGGSTIHATGNLIDPLYRHVMKLDIHQTAWQRFVSRRLLPALPAVCQRLVKRWWPRYALPDCVVLKKLQIQERGYVHCFENEQTMYRRLAAFQGRHIPYFYGEAQCEGTRALLVSFVPGVTARTQPKPRLTVEELLERIRVPAKEIAATTGIVYGDGQLTNAILTDDGRAVLIDLEMAEDHDLPEKAVECLLEEFEMAYKRFLAHADKEEEW